MASLFVHAALPLAMRRAFPLPEGHERRWLVTAAALGCVADLDMLAYLATVRPPSVFAHGGFAHSLVFAAILALVATLAACRGLGLSRAGEKSVAAFFFFAAALHPLLDATTTGDVGVALFAPFENGRHLLPWKLLPGCPLGIPEYFGFWGVLTFANELLYVVIPAALLATWIAARRAPKADDGLSPRRMIVRAAAWALAVVAVRVGLPEYFVPLKPRILRATGTPDAGDPKDIPRDGLPEGKLVTTWDELAREGLTDRDLRPTNPVWSSSFFPSWYGGESGRWKDGPLRLTWRTLTGFAPPTSSEAHAWLKGAEQGDALAERRLFTLAPTEKLDLVYGRYDFPATVRSLGRTHNGSPRYWNGRCNGVAAASLVWPEPFRVVDVIGVDGARVRFHPNDVKSLLAVAYYQTEVRTDIGRFCDVISFDASATCSMNPAILALVIANRIGRAHASFIIDAIPTAATQFYAVAGARIAVVRPPYPAGNARREASLEGRVTSLTDVRFDLTLSSTTLADAEADVLDPTSADGTRYQKVGLHPVQMHFFATLALDGAGALVGGVWTSDPAEGPDDVLTPSGGPALVDGKILDEDLVPWPFVRELAKKSSSEEPAVPTLDLRTQCDGACPPTESRTP